MTLVMPSETARQDRVWMAFPPNASYLCDTPQTARSARRAWASVARAILDFEPVTMVVDPRETGIAADYLDGRVEVVTAPLNDAWMRDIGPTFVHDEDGSLHAINWVFNGWGAQEWSAWDLDSKIGAAVAERVGAQVIDSPMVNEGGGIHVDGLGTCLVTETVQLDRGRNPGWTREMVEAELAATIGATTVIWLPSGLTRDNAEFGTRGHVDIVATIPSPGRLLVHVQTAPEHPDHALSRDVVELLSDARDARGERFEILGVPAPATLKDDEGWVDWSYINHLVVNDGVIGCAFDDEHDDQARELLAAAYPGREVVMVDARDIFAGGGGVHCITQHQPSEITQHQPSERG